MRIAAKDARQVSRLEFTFDEDGGLRLRKMSSAYAWGVSPAPRRYAAWRASWRGRWCSRHDTMVPLQRKQTFYVYALPSEVDDLAALIRGGELPVKLDRASVKENPVAPPIKKLSNHRGTEKTKRVEEKQSIPLLYSLSLLCLLGVVLFRCPL